MQPVGRLGAAFRRRVRPLGVVALGLALLAASHGPWDRIAGAEPATAAVQRSASDAAIARWTERVKVAPDDGEAWISLGDAFMQKARESADPGYYRRAEAGLPEGAERRDRRPSARSSVWRGSMVRSTTSSRARSGRGRP